MHNVCISDTCVECLTCLVCCVRCYSVLFVHITSYTWYIVTFCFFPDVLYPFSPSIIIGACLVTTSQFYFDDKLMQNNNDNKNDKRN